MRGLHYAPEGFISGSGEQGYHANVRAAIKRIRNKFHECDPTFVEIENYAGFGYRWGTPAHGPHSRRARELDND